MKRRKFLKSLTATAGSLLYAPPAPSLPGLDKQNQAPLVVKPVRGLIEKDGKLWQPIQVSFTHQGKSAAVVTLVDGVERDRRTVTSGPQRFEILTEPVTSSRTAPVRVNIEGKSLSSTVTLKPVRRVTIYVLPHSHNDVGYTEVQPAIEQKQMRNLKRGIELARQTAGYPEGARFVWNVEVLWGAYLYMQRMSAADKSEFMDAVRKGWVGLNGMFANELTGLCRPEELLQLFRYSTELADLCGVKVDSAMISDVPGYTWGTVTAMAQAGIRYFSVGPNWLDRIGTLMEEWQDKPFWWVSPSGKERVLLWIPWTGYALSHVIKQVTPEWVGEYQDRLDKINFPYDITYVRWSGHGDNAEPDPGISESCKTWNTKYAWPKFRISTTSEAFGTLERQYGKQLPEFKGDLTPYWEDGAASSALETAMNRNAADRLVQAAALFAMRAPQSYPTGAFNEAWSNVLLYSEHTWGAWCSVTDPENKLTLDQWEFKRAYAVDADKQSRELLTRPFDEAPIQPVSGAVDVYNTTSWPRTELVLIPKELSAGGDRVTDADGRPVPSQRLSTGELAIWATEVPPFSAVRYSISQGEAYPPGTRAEVKGVVLSNGIVQARIDEKTGGIVDLRHERLEGNLADTSGGEQINQYLFLPGSNLADLKSNGPVTLTVEENGPLVASLRIESDAPGCNRLVRKVRLIAGAQHLEICNIVDKKRAPENPNPGKGRAAEEFAQRGGKESLQFAFPFKVRNGQIRIDIPLAVMRPEADQIPGSCKNWLCVGRWIDVANETQGVTWATLDAPLVEVGGITANIPGSQHNPEVWRKHIEPTQKFYSWVMNNHWHTNYRAYQEGVVTFRYALRPHTGYDPVEAARFATGLSQPLLPVAASGAAPASSPLLRVEPSDVLVTVLKPSDDGKAWIIRLFGGSGQDRPARLVWASPQPKSVSISDLSEKPGAPLGDTVTVPGWDLVTVRAEF
ncbi:MAG TPA: glycoside hydrolase family 38 C-terminal domain-containing protein [Terriglobia bacterium]|nr:glycoside hydrolase family 38 C-terminal domain-containing protein [Terriglobia bacterium]